MSKKVVLKNPKELKDDLIESNRTVKEMASRIGISSTTLHHILAGKNVGINTRKKMLEFAPKMKFGDLFKIKEESETDGSSE